MDIDNSGFLEKDELEAVMTNVANDIGVDKPTKAEVEEVLNELDTNKDGNYFLFLIFIFFLYIIASFINYLKK